MTNNRSWYLIEGEGEPPELLYIDEERGYWSAWATGSLTFAFRLDRAPSTKEEALQQARAIHPNLTPIDLGDYLLYRRYDEVEKRMEVGATQGRGFEPVLARDVARGTYLLFKADSFFRLWKGDDAVRHDGILMK